MRRLNEAKLLLLISLLGLNACSSELSGGNSQDGEIPGNVDNPKAEEPSDWTPGNETADPNAVSALPLGLITSDQYENTVRLVFSHYGVELGGLGARETLQAESVDASGFLVVGEISDVSVLRYLDAAEDVANVAMPSSASWAGCAIASTPSPEECIRTFVSDFGRLLYRQPLTAEQIEAHVGFFLEETGTLGRPPEAALSQLLQSMLNSPLFLYRWEVGPEKPTLDGGAIRLSSYQIASRLAFYLWNSGPDRSLLAQAEAGALSTEQGIAEVARSMLDDARAEQALDSFHTQWLHLEKLDNLLKDPVRFPEWGTALGAAMHEEISTFARHVILEGDGSLKTLLSAPFSFVNEPLAKVYGLDTVSGTDFQRVDLPADQRAGLLTMPGLLAAASEPSVENPFKRGKLLLEKILCQKLEPPPNIPPIPQPDEANPRPIRETLEELTANAPCSNCHSKLNPLGFSLANFNAIGAYQEQDELGFPIDAAGQLPDGTSFANPRQLSALLAETTEVRACLTKQWFRFATNRAENSADDYSLESAFSQFSTSEFNLKELLVALVTTRSFLYRSQDAGEVLQ